MSSFWLCFDPEPARELQERKNIRKNNTPFFGVFNQNPEIFGRKIQRPITPFLGNSTFGISTSNLEKQESPNSLLVKTSQNKFIYPKSNDRSDSDCPLAIF